MRTRRLAIPFALALASLTSAASAADRRNAEELTVPRARSSDEARAQSAHFRWIEQHLRAQKNAHVSKVDKTLSAASIRIAESKGKVSIDHAAGTVTASSSIEIEALLPGVSGVYLYAAEPLKSETLVVTGPGGPLAVIDVGSGVNYVALGAPLAPSQKLALTVDRTGTPDCTPQEFLSLSTCGFDPAMTFAWQSWQVALLDDSGGLLEPGKTSLDVTAPSGLIVAATGASGPITKNPDGTKTYSFTNTENGSLAFAAAPFSTGTKQYSGFSVTTYLLPSAAADGDYHRQSIGDIVEFHAARYGAYGLPKMDMAQLPGMDARGPLYMVFMSEPVLFASGHYYDHVTLAHEIAHSWFGGFVTGGWASGSPWIEEGFATMAESYWTIGRATKELGFDYGPEYRRLLNQYYFHFARDGVDVAPSSPEVMNLPAEMFTAVTYCKGTAIVGMLRDLVGGDEKFFEAVRAYRKDHHHVKSVDIESLFASFSAASGKDVKGRLEKYVFEPGYPTYRVRVEPRRITLIADKQYPGPIEIELVTADGERKRELVEPGGLVTVVEYAGPSELLQARVDPDHRLFARIEADLTGDIHMNGEVDGIDLVYAALPGDQAFDPLQVWLTMTSSFADFADLDFDGHVDQQDRDIVSASFGKRQGEP